MEYCRVNILFYNTMAGSLQGMKTIKGNTVQLGPLHGVVGALSLSGTGGGGGPPMCIGKQKLGAYSHLYGEYVDPWMQLSP
jgi:hypothetical protein